MSRAAIQWFLNLLSSTWPSPPGPLFSSPGFLGRYLAGRLLQDPRLEQFVDSDEDLRDLRDLLTSKSKCFDAGLTPSQVIEKCPWLRDVSPSGRPGDARECVWAIQVGEGLLWSTHMASMPQISATCLMSRINATYS